MPPTRHIFTSLAAILLLAAAPPAAASTYTDSDTKTFSGDVSEITVDFQNLPEAVSDVTVGVDLWGAYRDENGIARWAEVDLDGRRTERMCDSGCTACNTSPDSDSFTLPASAVDDGTLAVTVRNSEDVRLCRRNKNQARVRVEYATNDPPVAQDDQIAVDEDDAVDFELQASDPDGDSLTYNVTTQPLHGELSGTPPQLTYTPDPDFNGSDRLQFVASDGTATSEEAEISITVRPVNDPPTWVTPDKLEYETPVGERFEVQVRAEDPDDDSLDYGARTPRAGGTFDVSTATFTWTPEQRDVGTHEVTFTATDGRATIDRTIEIDVVPSSPDAGDGRDAGDTGPDGSADARSRPEYDVRGGGCSVPADGRLPAESVGWLFGWILLGLLRRRGTPGSR